MPNYQNGKIYSIRSPNNEKYYIGSTTQKLSMRMAEHRRTKDLLTSKEIINSGGAYIELIENYSCNNKEELLRREGEIMRQFKDNIINKNIAGRTKKEYDEDNKDKIKEHRKEYFKEYKEDNKDKIKKYREDNKEHLKEYIKEYHKERALVKIKCGCGSITNLQHKSRHEKSIKHINFIKI
jgi:hypothetical protein